MAKVVITGQMSEAGADRYKLLMARAALIAAVLFGTSAIIVALKVWACS